MHLWWLTPAVIGGLAVFGLIVWFAVEAISSSIDGNSAGTNEVDDSFYDNDYKFPYNWIYHLGYRRQVRKTLKRKTKPNRETVNKLRFVADKTNTAKPKWYQI